MDGSLPVPILSIPNTSSISYLPSYLPTYYIFSFLIYLHPSFSTYLHSSFSTYLHPSFSTYLHALLPYLPISLFRHLHTYSLSLPTYMPSFVTYIHSSLSLPTYIHSFLTFLHSSLMLPTFINLSFSTFYLHPLFAQESN